MSSSQDAIEPPAAARLDPRDVRFFCGSSNRPLAQKISAFLGIPLEETQVSRFSNDNMYIQLGASVRGRRVYILQSLSPPVNDHLMEMLMMLDIAKGAGASEVTAIMPYFSFARSDKKDAPRISITARLIADLMVTAGATHVMSMQLHSPQVHGFFSVPTDPLTARPTFEAYFRNGRSLDDAIVVAPDAGGAKSAWRFASRLGLPMATGNKTRISDSKVIISGLVGKTVRGFKHAIIYDDEVATGSSVVELSHVLVANEVERITVVCTHGVFTAGALDKLSEVPQIERILTTDTVDIPVEKRVPKLEILSVAGVFGLAIQRNYNRESIGDLFVYGQ